MFVQEPEVGCDVSNVSDQDLEQRLEGSSGEDLNSSSGDEFCFLENEVPSQVGQNLLCFPTMILCIKLGQHSSLDYPSSFLSAFLKDL